MGVVDQAKSVAGMAGDVAKKSASQAGDVAKKGASQAGDQAKRRAAQASEAARKGASQAGEVAKKGASQATAAAKKSASQASQVAMRGATQAQDALQGLVNDLRLRRKADSLARQLGYLIAHEPKGKTALKDEVDLLAQEIRGLEHRIAESLPAEPEDDPGDDNTVVKTRH
jgi:hypothetical protein